MIHLCLKQTLNQTMTSLSSSTQSHNIHKFYSYTYLQNTCMNTPNMLRGVRFSWRCCWGYRCSGMWRCVTG